MHQPLIIASTQVKQDGQGRYCLNDLHRAAGGDNRHRPSLWVVNQQTTSLIDELQSEAGIPALDIQHGGATPGTFVCKELVYAYAMWISAKFHLQVIRAYDAVVAPAAPVLALPQDYIQALESLLASKKSEQVALAQLAIAAPKAEALDLLTLADGAMCITNAAKAVSKQPKALFSWLRANDWIYRRPGGVWCAYQPRIKSGLLTHKVTTVSRSDGTEKIVEQVLVTAKGLAKLAEVAA